MLHTYTTHDIGQCLNHKAVVFVGDSTIRRLFWATARRINAPLARDMELAAEKHSDETFQHGDARLKFTWDPFLNATSDPSWLGLDLNSYSPWNGASTAAVLFSSGLWHAKHLGDDYLEAYKTQVKSLTTALSEKSQISALDGILPPAYRRPSNRIPMFLPVIQPDQRRMNADRASSLTTDRLDPMNEFLRDEAASGRIELFQSFGVMTRTHPWAFEADGLHASDHLTSLQANMLFNFLCNSQPAVQDTPHNKTCCNIAPASCMGAHLLFAACLFLLLLVVSIKVPLLSAAYRRCRDSGIGLSMALFLLALFFCFAADRSSLFEKVNKPINLTAFVVFSAVALIVGFPTTCLASGEVLPSEKHVVMPPPQRSFFSRQQSDEWKGWMQLLILLYHYFGMSRILWVYQVARLLVASYLFMTAFGHTTYFLRTTDFSARRVVSVLLRLNLLSCALCYIMSTSYDFYYFSGLCSFWFVVVYTTLSFGFSEEIALCGIIARCLSSIICVNGFIFIPGLLEGLSAALKIVFKIEFHASEFRFRAGLDMYSVYVGILVGWLYHMRYDARIHSWLESRLRLMGRLHWTRDNEALLYSILKGGCAAILISYLVLVGFFSTKQQYNKWHPWISPFFVLAYVTLRNSTRRLRDAHSPLFAWLGRCSLETYILQCHIWLAGDTKGLLRLGLLNYTVLGDLFEAIIITALFIWTSWHVSRATGTITAAALGSKSAASPRAIAGQLAIVSIVLVCLNWLPYLQLHRG
jgi:N-acetylneuraminate 9-O-acetyltransferase